MRKVGIFTLAFLLGFLFMQAALGADCSGYPEKRVLLGSQSWWVNDKFPFPGSHLHLTTCFPLHQKVRGVVHFDVHLALHDMQGNGAITWLRAQIYGNGSDTTRKSVSLKCDVADCNWVIPFDVDTTKTSFDGRWEWRMTANVPKTADGSRMFQTTRWHAILDNGKPVKNGSGSSSRSPGAGGWYTGVDYENVHCGISDSGYKFVATPQSGVVSVTCSFSEAKSFASIDPTYHADGGDGLVLLRSGGGTKTISIDTKPLTNGQHFLFLRTDAVGASPKGIGSGILLLPFTVVN